MKHSLRLFPEAQHFLDALASGTDQTSTTLNPVEQLLLRRLAGLPIQRHPPKTIETILALRSLGHTYRQIAQMTGLPISTVNYHLNKHR